MLFWLAATMLLSGCGLATGKNPNFVVNDAPVFVDERMRGIGEPEIRTITPTDKYEGPSRAITILFEPRMDRDATADATELVDRFNNDVPVQKFWRTLKTDIQDLIELIPISALRPGEPYTIRVRDTAKSANGQSLPKTAVSTFTFIEGPARKVGDVLIPIPPGGDAEKKVVTTTDKVTPKKPIDDLPRDQLI